MAVEPAFVKANMTGGDNDDLRTVARCCFQRALGVVYSRSHGRGSSPVDMLQSMLHMLTNVGPVPDQPPPVLCPLHGLVDGARDEDCNTEVLGFDHGKSILRSIKAGE
jgi:hypothetical protein